MPDDQILIKKSLGGETSAYGDLVRRYQQTVFAACYRILGQRQDAEDAVQEVFLRAHRYLAGFDSERPFGPWIRRIAANFCRDELKKKGAVTLPLFDESDRPAAGGAAGLEAGRIAREQRAHIRQAVESLPEHYRTVIELRHFDEMSYEEIAQELELPLNTVKSHLLRARKLLMERLKDV